MGKEFGERRCSQFFFSLHPPETHFLQLALPPKGSIISQKRSTSQVFRCLSLLGTFYCHPLPDPMAMQREMQRLSLRSLQVSLKHSVSLMKPGVYVLHGWPRPRWITLRICHIELQAQRTPGRCWHALCQLSGGEAPSTSRFSCCST